MRQSDLCLAKRKQVSQGFVCRAIHELRLFFLDFRPLQLQSSDGGKSVRIEQGVPSLSQIHSPLKMCASVSRTARKLPPRSRVNCSAVSGGSRLQNSIVSPAVVFVQPLNLIFSHSGDDRLVSCGETYIALVGKTGDVGFSSTSVIVPSAGLL